jgi:hypothetical protein
MSSINTLVGTFSSVGSNYEVVPDELIAIDTSNNRLGINTIDPSYTIHVKDSTDSSGTIFTSKLIVDNEIFYNPDKIDPSLQNFDGITYNNLIYKLYNSTSNNFTKDQLKSGELDLSFQNLDISGSLSVQTSITVNSQNVVLQNQFDSSFSDVDTRLNNIDTSFDHVNTRLNNIDISLNNIDTSFDHVNTRLNNIDISLDNIDTSLDNIDTSFDHVNTRLNNIDISLDNIDNSFGDVYTKSELQSGTLDLSFLNLDICGSLSVLSSITVNSQNVVLQNQFDTSFDNVYTKSHIDNSYSTIELSGNIIGNDVSQGFITFDSSFLYVRITNSSWGRIGFTDYINI